MTLDTTFPVPLARLLVPIRLVPRAWLANLVQRHLRRGELNVTWPDGRRSLLQGAAEGPSAQLTLHSWRALGRLVTGGSSAFADSYIDGDWDSEDPARLIELGARNREAMDGPFRGNRMARAWRRFLHFRQANTRPGSRRNIAAHYDIGNAFYRTWLDDSMTYSSGVYAADDANLSQAQAEKYARILGMLDAKPGQHIVEIGCGWGGFALFAAERGLRVTGITLSREQHDEATRRALAAGVADRVEIRRMDYRDLDGKFDHAVSIEMIEAVGEAYWPAYFAKVASLLTEGGRFAVQAITIDEPLFEPYRDDPDFIQTHIFPGGMLPSLPRLRAAAGTAGLVAAGVQAYGLHYARTLREWRERFVTAWPTIAAHGFDAPFFRLWNLYLAYCEGGFRAGTIDLHQVLLVRR